ncbi:class I adenylate-forming enzyme family protein [Micromonospora echinofusca]|uniref:AMP-binding protein n=1 Tax=Micromonospora echinofusca TaxID=47858 RepID=A0ABS3VQ35_MICEH|nr:class I adenylate-forming enzyme family protein [Micromonospora echinofusca]MBO4206622.1 AMP-binding protein [Micromonospora echinofusca]
MTGSLSTHDLVPSDLRREWAALGLYPDRTLFDLFREQVAAHPDRAAVICDDGTTTYAELYGAVLSFAAALHSAGVRPGDVVGSQQPNGWRSCVVDLAVAAIGAVVLPYPPGRGRRETFALLGRSGATATVTPVHWDNFDYAATLDSLRGELPALRTVFVIGGEHPGCLPADPVMDRGNRVDPAAPLPEWIVDGDPDGPVRILVSSGSEAEPKMILYSHNALAGGRGAFMSGIAGGVSPLRNLFLPPLGTSYGSLGSFITIACHGGTLILVRKFSPAAAARAVREHRPTHVFGVPAVFQLMLGSAEFADVDTDSIRAVVSGGSKIDTSTIEECIARFDCNFVNLYGSADGVNCYTDLDDPTEKVHTTVGRPDPRIARFRIVDGEGRDVPQGEEGEMICRGPLSPMCYVNAPELDARYRTQGGWVRTGDLGFVDTDGYLTVVRRMKDIIIRGGKNISPVEVELLATRHPAVRAAICLGVPDPVLGERIGLIVVPEAGSAPGLPELTTFLTGLGLEQGKLPERLVVVDDLPLGAAGKVDKPKLAQLFTDAPVPA